MSVTGEQLDLPVATIEHTFAAEYSRLVRLATLLTGSQSVGEEVVMDAFTSAAARWATIERPAAYLQTAVVNGARSSHRRRGTETAKVHLLTAPGASEDAAPDEVWGVLAELTEDQRTCIVLRCYEDLTVDRIAELTGMKAGTVKSHLHRAAARLRPFFEERR